MVKQGFKDSSWLKLQNEQIRCFYDADWDICGREVKVFSFKLCVSTFVESIGYIADTAWISIYCLKIENILKSLFILYPTQTLNLVFGL